MKKNFDYFDHDADIGIVGSGTTLEEAFESAASAMFALMSDIDSLNFEISIDIGFEEDDLEFALVRWLNILLSSAQTRHIVLGKFELHRKGSKWIGRAWGDSWTNKMLRGVEVKGATLTKLFVKHSGNRWKAGCVVDV